MSSVSGQGRGTVPGRLTRLYHVQRTFPRSSWCQHSGRPRQVPTRGPVPGPEVDVTGDRRSSFEVDGSRTGTSALDPSRGDVPNCGRLTLVGVTGSPSIRTSTGRGSPSPPRRGRDGEGTGRTGGSSVASGQETPRSLDLHRHPTGQEPVTLVKEHLLGPFKKYRSSCQTCDGVVVSLRPTPVLCVNVLSEPGHVHAGLCSVTPGMRRTTSRCTVCLPLQHPRVRWVET